MYFYLLSSTSNLYFLKNLASPFLSFSSEIAEIILVKLGIGSYTNVVGEFYFVGKKKAGVPVHN
jgi:hypothetical protein